MPEALFHGDQDIGVAAGFDEDHPVWVKTGEMQGRGEQVAPFHAPEHGAYGSRQNSGEKYGGGRVVSQFAAAGDLVQRPGRQAAVWQMIVYGLDIKRKDRMP